MTFVVFFALAAGGQIRRDHTVEVDTSDANDV